MYVPGELTWEKWWDGLRAGRCFVTNGPLILPMVREEYPGEVFTASGGEVLKFTPQLQLFTRDKISYLEVVKNGEVAGTIRLKDWAQSGGRLPEVTFERSGWFLLRAVTDNDKTFRFVSTAPYYVKIGAEDRISRRSVQFFLDWIDERTKNLKIDNADQKAEVLAQWEQARQFWQQRMERANAE